MRPSLVFIRSSKIFLVVLYAVFFAAEPVQALDVPALKGRVNDYAHILSPSTITQMENALSYFEQQESTQLVVLTIPTLSGDNLEDFSMRVAETWKIGQKKLDNGAILLIAKQERKLRIEVGYGLEGKLTDLVSARIIRDVIVPQFKNGNFDQGILNGVTAMMAAVKGEFKATTILQRNNPHKTDPADLIGPLIAFLGIIGAFLHRHQVMAAVVGAIGCPLIGLFFFGFSWIAFVVLIFIGLIGGLVGSTLPIYPSGRGGFFSGSSGDSFDGDSGGFSGGGGSFGGGGASGDW
jgi:uncharacterized protein